MNLRRQVASGQGSGARGQGPGARRGANRRGFTLLEMLVVLAIIGILTGIAWGGYVMARNSARMANTRSTIAKLNNIILERWESYATRRVPLDLSTATDGTALSPTATAIDRLCALRDIMRMEMPDRVDDIVGDPITLPNSGRQVPRPALSHVYWDFYNSASHESNGKENGPAEMLYLLVSRSAPEVMEQFSTFEIGDTNNNGWLEFLDGWGRPIFFLRWAPAFSNITATNLSPLQMGDATKDHDPFDSQQCDSSAFRLVPLIYSGGPKNDPGINLKPEWAFCTATDPTAIFSDTTNFLHIGEPLDEDSNPTTSYSGITNHDIETR